MAESPKKAQKTLPKVCVAGGGGFIGSWLAKRLKTEGHEVVVADIKRCEYFEESEFCDTFHQVDLRIPDNAILATKGCQWVFNLAADMGGMGFIQSNHSRIGYNSTLCSLHVLEAARKNKCERYFYSSSACCYPECIQEDENGDCALREDMAWKGGKPQDIYGMEKLYAEEVTMQYGRDFPLITRVARFHNIYGDHATWKGGREKAPAAFARKIAYLKDGDTMEMWGDGKQTRSFCYIDDCVEGVIRLMKSDCDEVLNIGSDEITTMNNLADVVMKFDDKKIIIKHIDGPEGVRGRNSQNDLIKEKLGWAPSISLEDGMRRLYNWIKGEIKKETDQGIVNDYSKSTIVQQVVDEDEE